MNKKAATEQNTFRSRKEYKEEAICRVVKKGQNIQRKSVKKRRELYKTKTVQMHEKTKMCTATFSYGFPERNRNSR